MSTALQLIRLIIELRNEGAMAHVLKEGVVTEMFSGIEASIAWKLLFDHYRDKKHYHQIPSMELFKKRQPSIDLPATSDSLDQLIAQIKLEYQKRVLTTALTRAQEHISTESPEEVFNRLITDGSVIRLASSGIRARPILDLVREYVTEPYFDVDSSRGYPWPWPTLNRVTPGIERGHTTVLYGRPSAGKSWLLAHTIANLLRKLGSATRFLVNSADMSEKEFTEYLTACLARIPVGDMLRRELSPVHLEKLADTEIFLDSFTENGGLLRVVSAPGITAGDLYSLCEDLSINVLFVDGVYRLKDERSGKQSLEPNVQAGIVQSLKDLGLALDIPVIVTTQANREGEDPQKAGLTLAEQAFTDSIGMEAANVIRILPLDNLGFPGEKALIFPKLRKAPPTDPIRIGGRPATDFKEKGVWLRKFGKTGGPVPPAPAAGSGGGPNPYAGKEGGG